MQGSIQITPTGLPIISSVDGQTIGGYPRIANVISADLPMLGQLKAKDTLQFTLITQQYAIQIHQAQQLLLYQSH
jgi:allophanate hydrolase subunit 2